MGVKSRLLQTILQDKERIARAIEQGFDTSKIYYHAGDSGIANTGELRDQPMFLTGNRRDNSWYLDQHREPAQYPVFLKKEKVGTDADVFETVDRLGMDPNEAQGFEYVSPTSTSLQPDEVAASIQDLKDRGINQLNLEDYNEMEPIQSRSVLDPRRSVRSIWAQFKDPNAANISAGAAGAAVGAGSLLAPEEAEAGPFSKAAGSATEILSKLIAEHGDAPMEIGDITQRLIDEGLMDDSTISSAFDAATWGTKDSATMKWGDLGALMDEQMPSGYNRLMSTNNPFSWLRPENRLDLSQAGQDRLRRAEDLNYDTNNIWWHGTSEGTFPSFRKQTAFFTEYPWAADEYSQWSKNPLGKEFTQGTGGYQPRSNIQPYMLKKRGRDEVWLPDEGDMTRDFAARQLGEEPAFDFNTITYNQEPNAAEYSRQLMDEGVRSVYLPQDFTPDGREILTRAELDPGDVRSIWAKFKNPKSRNTLAGGAAAATGLGALGESEEAEAGPVGLASKRFFHGTATDIPAFDRPTFFTDNPKDASEWATEKSYLADKEIVSPSGESYGGDSVVYPVELSDERLASGEDVYGSMDELGIPYDRRIAPFNFVTERTHPDEAPAIINNLRSKGHEGVSFPNSFPGNTEYRLIFDPSNVRTRFTPGATGALAGLGALGFLDPTPAEAMANQLDLTSPLQEQPNFDSVMQQHGQVDTIRPPAHGWMSEYVADPINELAENPVGNLIAPTGLADWAEKVAYQDDIDYLDRFFVMLDSIDYIAPASKGIRTGASKIASRLFGP